MNENRISISLSQADIDLINEAIAILTASEAGDKKNLAKLGGKSVLFVGKSLQYAESRIFARVC